MKKIETIGGKQVGKKIAKNCHVKYYLRPKISAAMDIRAQRLTVRLI